MNQSVRHGIPLLASGQAQKEVTHNEALQLIDRRLQLSVVSRRVAEPPKAPTPGSAFIVPDGAIGVWAGHPDRIASFDGFGWTFDAPMPGWIVWIGDEGLFGIFDGSWSAGIWPISALRIGERHVLAAPPATIASPSGGTVIDAESRQKIGEILDALRAQGLIQLL
jgi:hypothetical protein